MAVSLNWSDITLPDDPYLRSMLFGTRWDATTISYTFPADGSLYPASHPYLQGGGTYQVLSATMQRAVEGILLGSSALPGGPLSAVTPVAGFTLLQFSNANGEDGILRFGVTTAPPQIINTATGEFPGYATKYPEDANGRDGEVWFSVNQPYDAVALGNFGYQAGFIHEIGHALGLKHPFQEVEVNPTAMPAERDSGEFTVMTYRSYVGGSVEGGTLNEDFGFPQSWMMYDIAALQYLYGANYAFRDGDTTYSWSTTTGETFVDGVSQGTPGANRIFLTLWDGGGTDSYDLSNYATGLAVDLRPGAWSVLASEQLAKLDAYGPTPVFARGNVFNALLHGDDPRSLIENAIGGSGNDSIIGNIAANVLSGGAGDDRLAGREGDDTLDGGDGNDLAGYEAYSAFSATWTRDLVTGTVVMTTAAEGTDTLIGIEGFAFGSVLLGFDSASDRGTEAADRLSSAAEGGVLQGLGGDDSLFGQGGADIIGGGAGADSIMGGGAGDALFGDAGDDTLLGEDGGDMLAGGEGNDLIRDGDGQDSAEGGDGDDRLLAQRGDDILLGDAGNDTLFGGTGGDRLLGGAGKDMLLGAGGDDSLDGGADADYLNGGAENDTLLGGAGDDTLVGVEGSDSLSGDGGADMLWGGAGNDTLDGGAGNDRLWGEAGDDSLRGGAGNDIVWAGAGNDRLIGDAGEDTLHGGEGADIFQLDADIGTDWIMDFTPGTDQVSLIAWLITDFGMLLTNFAFQQDEGVLFTDGDGTGAVLAGVTLDQLRATDFLYYSLLGETAALI